MLGFGVDKWFKLPGGRVRLVTKFFPEGGDAYNSVEHSPHLRDQVGNCIWNYIYELVGPMQAPKITGMLLDLPIFQQKQFLMSYENLQTMVHEAQEHLRLYNEAMMIN